MLTYQFNQKDTNKLPTMLQQHLSLTNKNFRLKTVVTLLLALSAAAIFTLGSFIANTAEKFLNSDDKSYGYEQKEELPWHSMSDEELFCRALKVAMDEDGDGRFGYQQRQKVAFMFLTRGRLPLAPLWERFFKGHGGLYSIYVHSAPEFREEPPMTSVFYKRRIPSKAVEWGRSTMVDAERRLLANALLDHSNHRFLLLSESCIPLFNFLTIYSHLAAAHHSFISSFDDPSPTARGRYNPRMHPVVSLSDWRKGSQWFELYRPLAALVVSDSTFYPAFAAHCRPPCYVDEHYLATLVAKVSPHENSNRSLTWADWSGGGPHPARFGKNDVSEEMLGRVRSGFNCTYNGRPTTVCFLFARKFDPNALGILLDLAPKVLGFGSE